MGDTKDVKTAPHTARAACGATLTKDQTRKMIDRTPKRANADADCPENDVKTSVHPVSRVANAESDAKLVKDQDKKKEYIDRMLANVKNDYPDDEDDLPHTGIVYLGESDITCVKECSETSYDLTLSSIVEYLIKHRSNVYTDKAVLILSATIAKLACNCDMFKYGTFYDSYRIHCERGARYFRGDYAAYNDATELLKRRWFLDVILNAATPEAYITLSRKSAMWKPASTNLNAYYVPVSAGDYFYPAGEWKAYGMMSQSFTPFMKAVTDGGFPRCTMRYDTKICMDVMERAIIKQTNREHLRNDTASQIAVCTALALHPKMDENTNAGLVRVVSVLATYSWLKNQARSRADLHEFTEIDPWAVFTHLLYEYLWHASTDAELAYTMECSIMYYNRDMDPAFGLMAKDMAMVVAEACLPLTFYYESMARVCMNIREDWKLQKAVMDMIIMHCYDALRRDDAPGKPQPTRERGGPFLVARKMFATWCDRNLVVVDAFRAQANL